MSLVDVNSLFSCKLVEIYSLRNLVRLVVWTCFFFIFTTHSDIINFFNLIHLFCFVVVIFFGRVFLFRSTIIGVIT